MDRFSYGAAHLSNMINNKNKNVDLILYLRDHCTRIPFASPSVNQLRSIVLPIKMFTCSGGRFHRHYQSNIEHYFLACQYSRELFSIDLFAKCKDIGFCHHTFDKYIFPESKLCFQSFFFLYFCFYLT